MGKHCKLLRVKTFSGVLERLQLVIELGSATSSIPSKGFMHQKVANHYYSLINFNISQFVKAFLECQYYFLPGIKSHLFV